MKTEAEEENESDVEIVYWSRTHKNLRSNILIQFRWYNWIAKHDIVLFFCFNLPRLMNFDVDWCFILRVRC